MGGGGGNEQYDTTRTQEVIKTIAGEREQYEGVFFVEFNLNFHSKIISSGKIK